MSSGYFTQLEHELVAAAGREQNATAKATTRRPWRDRRARVFLVAVGVLVVASAPAAAISGVFRPHREPDGLVRLSERRVIAEGLTPDRGHWQLLASQSDVGFCFGIRLPIDPPDISDMQVSEGCGGAKPGTLTLASSSGGSLHHNGLVFGMAPDDAARIRVEARGVTVTVDTIDDTAGLAGRFYVAELPIRTSLGRTTVTALDSEGDQVGVMTVG